MQAPGEGVGREIGHSQGDLVSFQHGCGSHYLFSKWAGLKQDDLQTAHFPTVWACELVVLVWMGWVRGSPGIQEHGAPISAATGGVGHSGM